MAIENRPRRCTPLDLRPLCARECTRVNLMELTVHHRNHDHDYNPPDGSSNWEPLCVYCHDNEHCATPMPSTAAWAAARVAASIGHNPFAALGC